jgi:hypothetical protein
VTSSLNYIHYVLKCIIRLAYGLHILISSCKLGLTSHALRLLFFPCLAETSEYTTGDPFTPVKWCDAWARFASVVLETGLRSSCGMQQCALPLPCH